jgi:hypothetical protein
MIETMDAPRRPPTVERAVRRADLPRASRLGINGAWPLALLLAAMSLGGILLPGLYLGETASWAAQAVGQDWVDLVLAVPWIVISAAYARDGSRAGRLCLAGALLYAVYQLVIYAFALRFNALFLLYCAALGLSLFAVIAVLADLARVEIDRWFTERVPFRPAAALLIGIGAVFSALWLAEIVPALARGTTPASIVEAGVPANPVHVMDLSAVLPAHVAAGILLLRRRQLGYLLAPVLLAFDVLMSLSIAGMMIVMRLRGVAASPVVVAALALLALASAAMLVRTVRSLRR